MVSCIQCSVVQMQFFPLSTLIITKKDHISKCVVTMIKYCRFAIRGFGQVAQQNGCIHLQCQEGRGRRTTATNSHSSIWWKLTNLNLPAFPLLSCSDFPTGKTCYILLPRSDIILVHDFIHRTKGFILLWSAGHTDFEYTTCPWSIMLEAVVITFFLLQWRM